MRMYPNFFLPVYWGYTNEIKMNMKVSQEFVKTKTKQEVNIQVNVQCEYHYE